MFIVFSRVLGIMYDVIEAQLLVAMAIGVFTPAVPVVPAVSSAQNPPQLAHQPASFWYGT